MTPTHSRGARGQTYRYYVSPGLQQGQPEARGTRISATAIETIIQATMQRVLPGGVDPISKIIRVDLDDGSLAITLSVRHATSVRRLLAIGEQLDVDPADASSARLTIPTLIGARREGTRIHATSFAATRRDPVLINALRSAHAMLATSRGGTPIIEQVPKPCYQRRLVCLAFLSPRIQRAILAGSQPPQLRLEDLVRNRIPFSWAAQERWLTTLG